jgi:hypothetical protein
VQSRYAAKNMILVDRKSSFRKLSPLACEKEEVLEISMEKNEKRWATYLACFRGRQPHALLP